MTTSLSHLPKDIINEIYQDLSATDLISLLVTSQAEKRRVLAENADYLTYVKDVARPKVRRRTNEVEQCIENYDRNDLILVSPRAAKALNLPPFMKTNLGFTIPQTGVRNNYYKYSARCLFSWIKIYATTNSLISYHNNEQYILIDDILYLFITYPRGVHFKMSSIQEKMDDLVEFSRDRIIKIDSRITNPELLRQQYRFLCQEYQDLKEYNN